MRVIRGYRHLGLDDRAPAVTIGNFDGVHLGHQRVMRAAVVAAERRGVPSVVCTFDPHTQHVLRPDAAPPLLQTLDQRLRAMGDLGLDLAVVIPFDRGVAATPPEGFVDRFLLGELHVGSLHLSSGFAFGRDKAGNRAYLERRAAACGFRVERVPALVVKGTPVSSTRIRDRLAQGAVAEAAQLLGRPYALVGEVVAGAGRGRHLDARTANLRVHNRCIPAHGVYVCEVAHEGEIHAAVTNVGVRPTFGAVGEATVESHLLDHDGPSLYGLELEVRFLERLRDERRFESVGALRTQIAADVELARRFFAAREDDRSAAGSR